MIYKLMGVLTLLGVIGGSVLLGGPLERPQAAPAVIHEVVRDQEGYAARHARLIQTGPDGQPLYTVEAEAMQQLPRQGTVKLEQVRVGFRDDGGNVWNAWGDHGELGQVTGQVELVGNVQAAGLLPGTSDEAHLATERLHVDTQAQVVVTRETVTISTSDEHNRLQSQGLVANLRSGHVLLASDVHGIYVP
jgi:LPS export ABC transporter protein LptC